MKHVLVESPRKSRDNDIHVTPNFGREHEASSECWCHPVVDADTLDITKYNAFVWVHREDN